MICWPRWTHHVVIAVLVALQLVLPFRYYACGDKYDERFAWRMFSPTRMTRCHVQIYVDNVVIWPSKRFHFAWVSLAERGRRSVIDAMVEHLCDDGAQSVQVHVTCTDLDNVTTTITDGAHIKCSETLE